MRAYLKIKDNEIIAALLKKAEKLGFAEKAIALNFNEYKIERESKNSFILTGGETMLRLDLADKDSAIKQMVDTFGMRNSKAERIFNKAKRQSVSKNSLQRVKAILPKPVNPLKNKTINRGARK